MAPLLLRHLATSLTRRVVQMSRFQLSFSSSVATAYRSLCTLAVSPPRPVLSSSSASSTLLRPSLLGQCQHLLPGIQTSAGMKTKSALKRRCKDCFFVRRRGHLFVFCKTHPRHKQRQG